MSGQDPLPTKIQQTPQVPFQFHPAILIWCRSLTADFTGDFERVCVLYIDFYALATMNTADISSTYDLIGIVQWI